MGKLSQWLRQVTGLALALDLQGTQIAKAGDSPLYELFRTRVFDLDQTLKGAGYSTAQCKWVPGHRALSNIPFAQLPGAPSQKTGACLFESALAHLFTDDPAPGIVVTQLHLPQDPPGSQPVQAKIRWTPYRIIEPSHKWQQRIPIFPEGLENLFKSWGNLSRIATHYYQTSLAIDFEPAVNGRRLMKDDALFRLLLARPTLKIRRVELRLKPNSHPTKDTDVAWLNKGEFVLYEEGSSQPVLTLDMKSDWAPIGRADPTFDWGTRADPQGVHTP